MRSLIAGGSGGLAAAAAILVTAAPAGAFAPPPNPPPCTVSENGVTVPCTPAGLVPYLLGTTTFSAPLSAAAQDATGVPGDPGGSGTSNITLDQTNNKLCASTTWSGIDSKVVAGHIHGGAAGQPENPAITLSLFPADFVNGVASGATGCTTVPAPALYAIKRCPAQFSVVIHSFNHPVAAIRGQVGTTCNV